MVIPPHADVVTLDSDGCPQTYGWSEPTGYVLHVPGLASFRIGQNAAVEVHAERDADPIAVRREHLGMAVPIAQLIQGREVLHASGVLTKKGVIVFCGSSQAGKTTIAIALGARTDGIWADDAIVLRISERVTHAVALPFIVNARKSKVGAVNRLALADGARLHSKRTGSISNLLAVVVMEPSPQRATTLTQLRASSALHALLQNAYFFPPLGPARRRITVERLLTLAETVPVLTSCSSRMLEHSIRCLAA